MTEPLTLLPAVDVRDGKAVRLKQGESGSETDYGSPLEAAYAWADAGARWIHLVDLDAAFGTGDNRAILRKITDRLGDMVHIELSGGIRDDDSIKSALDSGASRVNIGTAALENPDWTASMIGMYADKVAVGLDVRGHTLAARGWVKEGGDLLETIDFLNTVNCARYVVTDVTRDGMMSGPNLELLREVAQHTSAKVTASGGISSLNDLRAIRTLADEGVDSAILGKALYARAFTLQEALDATQ
ncbi:MAG: bifunctional 1-(5-phosphoribosyl)-5-((5-phosphoribosylamino)methylideneamino)imidazole-4-carboxamide isomerase/phosphoribosylanthranilate isomerase PriA [Bifidobacteriaceae bacterium]|jgi:1-(5-phosphoribosyl)-5-[(5-phosphoribosylamino)methylideneamino] imidazole-4-carboxamide isomerase/N-(5'phosphoribosyl)anthranilate isomerase|nr:bifunctional 1-(5-phosphoribosyl)-5-((5-phosphoribosylamino)methylideneamino)imidazole-4-carboxamide isomerase/phosphoribosylanthranilate isomerase PriA [Bifidobacteriaceae bacterium]MCI1979055.1 bifunctional 1-(5-phosphoribosyl)-5-((5-phosphoribosylamino)methylideneamino)imidazole-4-carboxamide isomerase/phosphoribosylanthranilate isomerase PriA [Bifidobacteriaceae bacterium]